jgi:hypothetical protein
MELDDARAVLTPTTDPPTPRLSVPSAMKAKTRFGGWLAACGLLAGCGLMPSPDVVFVNAPAAVRERAPLPACGVETIRASSDADNNVEGRRCLWSAYQEHRPAEFVTTRPTVEGDPITYIYRVLPDGEVEVFVDSTRDAWSAKTWLRLACPQLALDVSAQAQPAFAPGEGCTETTIR